jgi:hypothetical protein
MMLQTVVDTTASNPILVGSMIPVLVSLSSRESLDPRLKALIAAAFALGAALYSSDGVVDQASIEGALANVFSAVAAYKGIWTHLNSNGWFPNFGIGPKTTLVIEPGDPEYVETD